MLLAALCAVAACKDSSPGGAPAAAPAADPAADDARARAAEELLARRDALMKSRQKVADDLQQLEVERVRIVEAGGDVREVEQQAEALRTQRDQLDSEQTAVADQMEAMLEEVRGVRGAGDAQAQLASREAGMASREKSLAAREDRVAQRESAMAARERALALREKETCSGGGTTTIIQTVDPKGTRYGKRDVEPLLKKARETMSSRGILASDLPSQAAGLEREANEAMADGDFGRARLAAQQLLATVEAQKVDRGFIGAKISRLSAAMKGRTLDAAVQREVDALFRDATTRYGDGDYAAANKKLNQIYRAIN